MCVRGNLIKKEREENGKTKKGGTKRGGEKERSDLGYVVAEEGCPR